MPNISAQEASIVQNIELFPANSLLEVCAHLTNQATISPISTQPIVRERTSNQDFNEVKGQSLTKRALEIAAAGKHSVLMSGPPGTRKSMLASRFAEILPAMSDEEALEAAAIQSLVGKFSMQRWRERPFRQPHHTASGVALVGGGSNPRPREISLAHHGVLFLDELPEFDRKVLEVLREPLESGKITISRATKQADFPASFQLIAAMNPCPCGYEGHFSNQCRCTPDQINRYRSKLSGPLLDRIDMHISVPALTHEELLNAPQGESTIQIRERVEVARKQQITRQNKPNDQLSPNEIEKYCRLDATVKTLIKQALDKLNLSARAYHRILKVSRTIADCDQSEAIKPAHLAEALQYRPKL